MLEELSTRPLSAILQKPYSPARACVAAEALLAACAEAAEDKPKGKSKRSRKSAEKAAALTL